MKLLYRRPTTAQLRAYHARQQSAELSYPEVGASRGEFPSGYLHDRREIQLGRGLLAWKAAKLALRRWEQFPLRWTMVYPGDAPLRAGTTVVVAFRMFGLWWLNSCRIVYTFDEPGRFGFAYGSLTDHAERGEEIFSVERDAKGKVFYRLQAFSRPNHWLTWLGFPYARYMQYVFGRDSKRDMRAACWQPGVIISAARALSPQRD